MDDDVNSPKEVILNSEVEEKVDMMDEGQQEKVSSEVLESRIHMINQLGDSILSETSELASLFERLTILWEDSTGSDMPQCVLNRSILHVAAKYVEVDVSGCLEQFVSFGIKASDWCCKHLKLILISIEESQEETGSSTYIQFIMDLLSFFVAAFSALIRSPIIERNVLVLVERYVSECLNVAKVSISEFKRIQSSTSSELLKVTQLILDASVRLCRTYSQALNLDSYCDIVMRTEDEEQSSLEREKLDSVNLVINLVKCTVDQLGELGLLATVGGGSLVKILNVSWKGVVGLLQLGKGVLVSKINVSDIIMKLISLATESLRCASGCWSSSKVSKEDITSSEAKRIFFPVKFYLLNAFRLSSLYTSEAVKVYSEIGLFVLMISAFGISLSKETSRLRAPSEALAEILEPASMLLLLTLLNSAEVKQDTVLQILDSLFPEESFPSTSFDSGENNTNLRIPGDEIFTVNGQTMPKARILMLGRVALFLNLLKHSPCIREGTRLGFSKKLGWLFDSVIEEEAYSSILALHIPVLHGSGTVPQLTWQPMLSFFMHALKIFMIVECSSSLGCREVEYFLLENFLHPHFIVSEIITELWCFIVRHADIEIVNEIIDKLCVLFKFVASSSELRLMKCDHPLRKMAKSICRILTHTPNGTTDRAYNYIINDIGNALSPTLSSFMYMTLLNEGFPLHLLTNDLKKLAVQRIISAYVGYIEENKEKLVLVDNMSKSSSSSFRLGEPVYAMSSVLHCLDSQISVADYLKTLNFASSVVRGYRSAKTDSSKEDYCELLNQIIGIVSSMKHLNACNQMKEVIVELHSLFVSTGDAGSAAVASLLEDGNTSGCLYRCKPNLSLLMAGLGDIEIVESEDSKTSTALWELYHMLLRERHWAFSHLAIAGFGHFASHTSCNQLWRFLPQDAALSFDIETGNEKDEDRFMFELKAFLEKEVALLVIEPCTTEQLAMLVKEGLVLKETVRRIILGNVEREEDTEIMMEIDNADTGGEKLASTKKRKLLSLPDEIGEGMALLQRGLKFMGDGLALWQQQQQHISSMNHQEQFLVHFSQLEDAITSLIGLAAGVGNG
ncbi:uncharacterized protein LOC113283136 isoform X1 [Papaver somniferum]|uniref:uncharacterized protein LOC113283136 isoform X1 n=1 Tax=Papaver somniferum TaxID=3469 RepID=UPI000E6FF278|nr:uncharacterized protein LOC113283136 isoform X1 [Papaver somniferum]